jgi:glutamate dehydrogenase (NAD(P)+)
MKPITELKPARIVEVHREDIGLHGWVVLDVREHGFACGGVRMRAEVTPDEIANLAREMSLKYRFLHIRKDGAKSGIVAPIDAPPARKAELCRAFGEQIRELIRSGTYTPGEDMGVGHAELDQLMLGAGFPPQPKQTPAEFYTALTAVICFEQFCQWQKLPMNRQRIAIEGYGKVGSCAGKLLAADSAKVVGISTALGAIYLPAGLDLTLIESLRAQHGDALVEHYPGAERLPREALALQPCDFFFPGAQPDSIHPGNVDQIQARALISIANIAADETAEAALARRGIAYFPGFVANCGGILSYYLREQDFAVNELEAFIREGFAAKIEHLLARAGQPGAVAATARAMAAEARIALAQGQSSLSKLLDPRRYLWLLYRKSHKLGLRNVMFPFACRYMRRQLFQA